VGNTKSDDSLRSQVAYYLAGYNGRSAKRNSKLLGELDADPVVIKRNIEKILTR
jgi:hypothetical protein